MSNHEDQSLEEKFNIEWASNFRVSPPLGYVLRGDWPDAWLRLHSLPHSQRYALTSSDELTVLKRANSISSECFSADGSLWIVVAEYGATPFEQPAIDTPLDWHRLPSWFDPEDEPEEQIEFSFYAALVNWRPSKLDQLFVDAAQDRRRFLLFSSHKRLVVAPYDGGFDIMCLDKALLLRLERRFTSWKSERADGL